MQNNRCNQMGEDVDKAGGEFYTVKSFDDNFYNQLSPQLQNLHNLDTNIQLRHKPQTFQSNQLITPRGVEESLNVTPSSSKEDQEVSVMNSSFNARYPIHDN